MSDDIETMYANVRISRVSEWLDCPLRMSVVDDDRIDRGPAPPPPVIDVGQFVGTAVHEVLATGAYAEPSMPIRYDRHTRSEQEMRRTIDSLVDEANRLLDLWEVTDRMWEVSVTANYLWTNISLQLSGRADLVCTLRDDSRAVLDVKTGIRPIRAEFMQVALYAAALEEQGDAVDQIGIIDIPRHFGRNASIHTVPVEEFSDAGENAVASLAREMMRARPRANPRSASCHRCEVKSCAFQSVSAADG